MMTPEARRDRARLAANTRWAKAGERDKQSKTLAAAYWRRKAREVDPDGTLPLAEREALMRAAARAELARVNLARSRRDAS